MSFITQWLLDMGLSQTYAVMLKEMFEMLCLIMGAIVANVIAKQYIVTAIEGFFKKTKNTYDDVFVERHVFTRLSHFAPALVIYFGVGLLFPEKTLAIELSTRLANAYMILIGTLVLSSLLNVIVDIYQRMEGSNQRPIKGYIQAIKLIVYFFAGLFIISTLMNKSPWGFLSVLGGLTAVLLLVFKDTILGLVASVQLMSNNMIARGDWIEMPKYGADGDVLDITLTTVKVQNWDKTITTIPTYALISDSFKNWRGMSESGGRRIKRNLYIDMNTIKFIDPDSLERFKKFTVLKGYLEARQTEIDEYNRQHNHDLSEVINGRRMTNVGIFRAYIIQYLKHNPKIHQNMTFLVRHLEPTDRGLPIQIYVFSNDQVWANYEAIQADIFDHLLAAVPEFGLKIFQSPSGNDFKEIYRKNS